MVAVLSGLCGSAQLEPIERAGSGQRMARVTLAGTPRAADVGPAHSRRQQAVVVADVFVAQREAEQARREQVLQAMLAATGIAVISEARCQTPGQVDTLVDGPQQQSPAIGGHPAAVKAGTHLPTGPDWEIDCDTVRAWGALLGST